MADRRNQNQTRRRTDDDQDQADTGLGTLIGILGGVALAVGAAATVINALTRRPEDEELPRPSNSFSWDLEPTTRRFDMLDSRPLSRPNTAETWSWDSLSQPRATIQHSYSYNDDMSSYNYESDTSTEDDIATSTSTPNVLAVDATPTRGGGLFLLPRDKKLYYYSVGFVPHFEFPEKQESDKFEMVNAFFGLTMVGEKFEHILTSGAEFIIKTDSGFFKSKYQRDSDNKIFKQLFDTKQQALNGKMMHVTKGKDIDMENANQLSRGGFAQWIEMSLKPCYPGYSVYDLSPDVERLLTTFKHNVPSKYLRKAKATG